MSMFQDDAQLGVGTGLLHTPLWGILYDLLGHEVLAGWQWVLSHLAISTPSRWSQQWIKMQERRRVEKREKDSSRGRRGSIFSP